MNIREKCRYIKRKLKDIYYLNIIRKRNGDTLKSFKNKHLGQRCFIIGNGPSLRMDDLEKLKAETTFAANKIYVAFQNTTWRPTYYVIQDEVMIIQDIEEIQNKVEAKTKFVYGEYFIKNKINWPTWTYFQVLLRDFNPNLPKFSSNINSGIYEGMTVTYAEIQMAIYMGFKEIYLLGIDFNYASGNAGYFSADYMKEKRVGKEYNAPDLNSSYLAYQAAHEYANKKGVKIYNATRTTKLDVFDKIDFDQISI